MSLLSPQLNAFMAIVAAKTVQAASKKLGITQTGVTQRIRSLEFQLEASLFIRSRRGMLLTQEGEALFRYCQLAKDLEGETLAKIKGAGIRSPVNIAILGPTSIMRTRIIPQCSSLFKKFPQILMSFEISDSRAGDDALRMGEVQFAIIPPHKVAKEMDSKLLKPEEYVLVGPKAWKNRSIKEIVQNERIVDFDKSDEMTHAYLKKFKLASLARPDRHFVNNNESLVQIFSQGLGYGVLTREFAELYVKQAEIAVLNTNSCLEHRLALAWYPRSAAPDYFKSILKSIH